MPAEEHFATVEHRCFRHISCSTTSPELIDQIASYLRAPGNQAIAADTVVMVKAAELGLLRFDQRASVHQVLRE